ncbi:MAG: efflux RND transporter periplasmic adaptor subunit [Gammaproteobacteria bacterium]|jgi:RND family efflux transporter MFP subunit|nr:efflux RND transporter periplasmic adaptor subunit [Gammaproteobacteria bacterium]MBT4491604.1 efflux RND transporter periplasmic adaptor subunit [Gammaproteobacteria bacterium]MBT7371623.1 efflux RND transporter periplasmic adaptor subunit [Gammaproteobacteria bacterium]
MNCIPVLVALLLVSFQAAAEGQTVIVGTVEEVNSTIHVHVNGLVRSRSDVLLPARISGQLVSSMEEGMQVSAGTVIAQVDRQRLSLSLLEQEVMAERAEVNLRYLEGEVSRLLELEKNNLAAKTQLAEMISRRDLAKNDLRLAQARIAQLENDLEETKIVSPIDGVIVERLIEAGEYARAGDTVVRVVDPTSLEITAAVPVVNLNRLDYVEPVLITLKELQFQARLRSMIQAGDRSSQTFDVIVDIPLLAAANLVTGQFVEVDVPLKSNKLLYVPRDAVVLRTDGSYVFRIDEQNVAQRISVELGEGHGSMVSVRSSEGSLKLGDRVAVRGVETLQDGQEVEPIT